MKTAVMLATLALAGAANATTPTTTIQGAVGAHAGSSIPQREEGDIQQARREIRRLWGASAPRVFCVIGRESGWRPNAVSATGDHGLLQLNAYTWRRYFGVRWARVYDPVENVRMGYVVWKRQGWAAWRGGRWECR